MSYDVLGFFLKIINIKHKERTMEDSKLDLNYWDYIYENGLEIFIPLDIW